MDPAADGERLVRWIVEVDEWHRAMREFRRHRLAKGSTGQLVLHPFAAYLKHLEAAIARTESEFGMTPLARMKLGIATGEAALTAQRLNELTRGDGAPDEATGDWVGEFEEVSP